jgi:hypothetical protein
MFIKKLEIRKQQINNTEKSIEPLLSHLQGVPLEVIVANAICCTIKHYIIRQCCSITFIESHFYCVTFVESLFGVTLFLTTF